MKKKLYFFLYPAVFIISGVGLLTTIFSIWYYPSKPVISEKYDLRGSKNLTVIEFTKLLDRNIFNVEGSIPAKGQLDQNIYLCASRAIRSKLPYNVLGILYGGNAQSSVVILQNKNNENILILKEGSKLSQKGYITNIESKRVWITETMCPEYLDLPKFKPPLARVRKGGRGQSASDRSYQEEGFNRSGSNTDVTREWLNDILENKLSSVLNDALVSPHMVNGQVNGFVISQIEPMSVFDKLGLKDGDIVTSMNGIQLNDAGRAIQTLNGLRNESEITMQVIRNGKETSFKVNIQK